MNQPHADPLRKRSERQAVRRSSALLACLGLALALGVVARSAALRPPPSFGRPTLHEFGVASLLDIAIADLNGDRKLDLAVTSESNTVYVLLNSGQGKFGAWRGYGTGDDPEAMAIGDLNGDGKPDLVTTNVGTDGDGKTLSVFLNRGDGTFAPRRDYETGPLPGPVAIGDLNGDGKSDLVTTANANSVSVLLNAGDGSFGARRDYQTGASPTSLAIGDVNGEGKPDLVITDDDADTVSVLLNGGDGSFEARREYGTGEQPESVAIGDLNGDGKPELVTANESDETVSVLAIGADGTERSRRDYRVGASPVSVAIADLNRDRKPDLATANFDGATVSVLANRGDGTFTPRRNYEAGESPEKVAVGDLNGDGRPDLAITTYYGDYGTFSVLRNTTGLCMVPNLRGRKLQGARRAIAGANCRVGKVGRAYSKRIKKGHVISLKPKFGTVLPKGGKVNLVISRGSRR